MPTPEPLRPDLVETVLFEPDEQRALAVLPGALWPSPGDVVELDDPPREARVLSTRLQLHRGQARVLVVVDVPEASLVEQATAGEVLAEVPAVLAPVLSEEIDRELAELEHDGGAAPA
jgi:hypothetical protein